MADVLIAILLIVLVVYMGFIVAFISWCVGLLVEDSEDSEDEKRRR